MTINQFFTQIANAIRTKKGTSNSIKATDFPDEILSISSGGGLSWNNIGYEGTPDEITDGFNYAKQIYDNWDNSVRNGARLYEGDLNLRFFPAVSTANLTSFYYTFNQCFNLGKIVEIDVSNATNLNRTFGNTRINTIKLKNTGNVQNINEMCLSCKSLTEVENFDTSNVTQSGSVFSGCENLTTIPNINFPKSTNSSSMFKDCKKIESINVVDLSKTQNFASTFSGCSKLKNINSFSASSATNCQNMFQNCSSLTNESLNNILAICISMTAYTGTKTLKQIGLTSSQATTCQGLSNWADFVEAGWTTGY